MKVYQTDRNGMYLGETEADESPLEPGVWLMPAGTVSLEPPTVVEGQWPRWNGEGWELVSKPEPDSPVPPPPPIVGSPLEKLKAFLDLNPDVVEYLAIDTKNSHSPADSPTEP
jgi:hypothetical protein